MKHLVVLKDNLVSETESYSHVFQTNKASVRSLPRLKDLGLSACCWQRWQVSRYLATGHLTEGKKSPKDLRHHQKQAILYNYSLSTLTSEHFTNVTTFDLALLSREGEVLSKPKHQSTDEELV